MALSVHKEADPDASSLLEFVLVHLQIYDACMMQCIRATYLSIPDPDQDQDQPISLGRKSVEQCGKFHTVTPPHCRTVTLSHFHSVTL